MNVRNSERPIFILGTARSGTSLMRRLVNSHSRIACPTETCFVEQLSRVLTIEKSAQGIRDMGFEDRDILKAMRVFIETFLSGYAQKQGKPRWAEKSCSYIMCAETIDRVFESEALYVGIVRNVFDVCMSINKFDLSKTFSSVREFMPEARDRPLIAAALFWQDRNRRLIDFGHERAERFHLLRYEDLTTSPKTVMKDIFSFLQEPWEEEILNYSQFKHSSGFEDPNVSQFAGVEENIGSTDGLSDEVVEEIWSIASDVMFELGYEDIESVTGSGT